MEAISGKSSYFYSVHYSKSHICLVHHNHLQNICHQCHLPVQRTISQPGRSTGWKGYWDEPFQKAISALLKINAHLLATPMYTFPHPPWTNIRYH